MSKSLIASLAALAVVIPVVALQFLQNGKLKTEMETLRTEVVRLERVSGGTLSGVKGAGKDEREASEEQTASAPDSEAMALAALSSLEDILAQRDPQLRLNALLEYVSGLKDGEIPNALAQLRANTPEWDPDARVAAQMMLTRWATADPKGALAYLDGLDAKKAGGDAPIILSAIAASEPLRAVEWLEDPENKLANNPWIGRYIAGSITKEWVRQDSEAALAWASSLPERQRTGAYGGALGHLAATDPARASELAAQLPEGDAKRDVLGQIARSWSQRDPARALEWANTLNGEERGRAVAEAVGVWASTAPNEAAAYVDGLEVEQRTDEMIQRVARNWAQNEPADAAQWLGGMPEGKGKSDAMGEVMWNWTNADPVTASEWLLEQPPGDSRDAGIGSLAKATFDKDPESAVIWAANMSDQGRKMQSVAIGVRVWLERDRPAAQQWLETTDALSDNEVEQILSHGQDKDDDGG